MIIDLPKLGAVKFRDDLTPEQFNAEVQRLSAKYDFKMPRPDIGLSEIAKRGFMRSVGETGIALGDVIPAAISSAFVHGGGDYAKRQMEEAAQSRAELEEKYPTRFKSYTEVGSPREALEYVAETGGELLPSVGTALIPGIGLEAVGARVGASAAARLAAERGLGEVATKALIEKGTQSAARKGMYGGVYMGSFAQNAPEVFEGIYQETGKFEPGIAALAGGIGAVLDSALPAKIFDGLGKYGKLKVIEELAKDSRAAPKVWKYVGKEAAQAAATEGLTESAQEAIGAYAKQVAGSSKSLFDPENTQQYKEAFVKGAIGGAGFGVPGGVAKGITAKQEYARQQQPAAGPTEQTQQPTTTEQLALPAPEQQLQLGYTEPPTQPTLALPAPTPPAAEAVTPEKPAIDVVAQLGLNKRSKIARSLAGIDLTTPEGVKQLITTLENPAFKGKINEEAYDALIKSLDPQLVEAAARADLQGAVDARQPNPPTGGEGATVDSATNQGAPTEGVGGGERPRVVPTNADVAGTNVGKEPTTPTVDPEKAFEEGKQALLEGQGIDDHPYGDSEFAMYFQSGWLEQERELQSELNPEDKAPQNKVVEPKPKTTSAAKVEKPVVDTTAESLDLKPTPKVDTTPDFTKDIDSIVTKLGDQAKKRGHTELEKDARAYFGRNYPDFAIRSIAHDLVRQKTIYRRSEMPSFRGRAEGPEFNLTEAESKQHRGQGGAHAKNADKWARANLSPETVAYLDKWIAKYTKEEAESKRYQKKAEKQQELKKNVKEQIKQDELSPVSQAIARSDIEEDLGKKASKRTRKDAKKLAKQALEEYMGVEGIDDIIDSGFNEMYASPDVASLYRSSHPSVLRSLRDGNLVDALGHLAETTEFDSLSKIAENLAKYVGNVNVVYGAKESKYDPKTNTIYLTEDATGYEVMHESAHAALSHILANPSHPVTRQLDKLFKEVKGSLDGAYGATNLQEFAAELWSNPELRTKLKEMRTDSPVLSMWDKIMNVLRKVLGFQPRQTDALDAADRLTSQIVSVPPASRMGDSLYAQSINNPNLADNIFKYVSGVTSGGTIMNDSTAVEWLAKAEKLGVGGRQVLRKFLNLSALGQVASKIVGKEAIEFADNVNAMAGYYENMMEKLNPLHKRLEEFAKTDRYEAWSRLVNETTRLDVNPNADAETVARYRNDNEKFINYQQFKAEYNRLNPTEKKLYDDLFNSYKVLFKELKASIRNNLLVKFPDDQEKALSVYNKIIDQITSAGVEHYAPLYRQGTYFLTYLDKDTNEHATELFTSQIERAQKKAELEGKGHTDFEEKTKFDQLQARNVPSGSIAGQIVKIMKDSGVGSEGIDNFLQLIVSAMPETSLLKSFTKRKGTAGYINDAALAFSNVTSSTARQLSRMRYSETLQANIDKMRETVGELRGSKATIGAEFIKEFEGRQKYAMNPSVADWARYASTGAFYFNLAGNVSSAAVNFLQTPMIVLPQLGGTYGYLKAGAALMKATKLYGASGFTRTIKDINGETVEQKAMLSVDNLLGQGKNAEYSELFKALKGFGFLQNSTARDALQASNRPPAEKGGAVPLTERVATYSAFLFHHAERMNREVTAIAAFDLEMERLKNKGVKEAEAIPQAVEKAIRMVEFTHGAGHTESGPSIGHSDIGKVLTVFKRFGFTMYYMLFDTIRRSFPISKDMTADQVEAMQAARRQLVGVYGMAGLFAGVKGMPLYWVAEMAYNALQDDDDDDFDTVMRKFLGDLAFKGPVNYYTNLGIADRVGWTDLIYRENKGGKADASALSQITEAILGAPYSIINSFYRGKELISEGHFERGVEAMLPIALRNILKGARYATEGANTLRGDPVMGDINGYNAMMQVLGFAPADLLARYEDNAYAKKVDDATIGQSKKLLKQYYIADRLGDYDRADMLRDKLFALSDKHDLGITDETINKSVTARDKISDEMYNGVQINKKLRNEIERSIMEMHD